LYGMQKLLENRRQTAEHPPAAGKPGPARGEPAE
jgi:hypothetical protein